MARSIFLFGVAGTFFMTAWCWSRLSHRSFTGDVVGRVPSHACPTLIVHFRQDPVPEDFRVCGCAEPAADRAGATAVHPPAALVNVASRGDRLGLSLHEYRPVFGGEVRKAVKWVLLRAEMGKQVFEVLPALALYKSIVLTGLAPFILGCVMAAGAAVMFRRRDALAG